VAGLLGKTRLPLYRPAEMYSQEQTLAIPPDRSSLVCVLADKLLQAKNRIAWVCLGILIWIFTTWLMLHLGGYW